MTQNNSQPEKPFVELYVRCEVKRQHGRGGWGAVLFHAPSKACRDMKGSIDEVTSNAAPLLAVAEGLGALKSASCVVVYSNNSYIVNGANGHLFDGKPTPSTNVQLWNEVFSTILDGGHDVKFMHLPAGHGYPHNHRALELAQEAIHEQAA